MSANINQLTMTEEELQLLLKDLCARLPYGVQINYFCEQIQPKRIVSIHNIGDLRDIYVFGDSAHLVVAGHTVKFEHDNPFHTPKPYLRPMSSMTKKEREEYNSFSFGEDWISHPDYVLPAFGIVDWLNEHHFDYRGLIEKGLALEAPSNMYKTE